MSILETVCYIKKCANMTYLLPSHSSIILTSADTVLQELFTHHGSGTMIRFLEKISRFKSARQIDKSRFKKLLQLSFGKTISEEYWERNEANIDTVFVSEKFSAAAVVLRIPGINVPYLDKIAVHPQYQGTGLAASLWNEVVKNYPTLFWRSKLGNKNAGLWYNTVSQGSWKSDNWIVYWYGLSTCEAVLPLVEYALIHPESFRSSRRDQKTEDHSVKDIPWKHQTGVHLVS